MEVFMNNVPFGLNDNSLRTQLTPFMTSLRILDKTWTCQKPHRKRIGSILFLRTEDGERFLAAHGAQVMPGGGHNRQGRPKELPRLYFLNEKVYCRASDKPLDEYSIRGLAAEAAGQMDGHDQPPEKDKALTLETKQLYCGHYDYIDGKLAFTADNSWKATGGQAKFAKHMLIITYDDRHRHPTTRYRVEIPFRTIESIFVSMSPTALTFTLWETPRLFEVKAPGLFELLGNLLITPGYGGNYTTESDLDNKFNSNPERTRINSIPEHGAMKKQNTTSPLPVYQVIVVADDFPAVVNRLKKMNVFTINRYEFPDSSFGQTSMAQGLISFEKAVEELSGNVSFDILFQLQALVQNGYLLPQTVQVLLGMLIAYNLSISRGSSEKLRIAFVATREHQIDEDSHEGAGRLPISALAIKSMFRDIPFPDPELDASNFEPKGILEYLKTAEKKIREDAAKELVSRRAQANVSLVYKAQVTPTGITLHGPEPEAMNRILRKFPDHIEYFLRVQFCEEDGQDIYWSPQINCDNVYQRFRDVLRNGISVAGRLYQFLGFSHSSLRAHTVWFMAPFVDGHGTLHSHLNVISGLGNFRDIRSPARCAARIGQAFSETPFAINLEENGIEVGFIADVKSKDGSRVFSDGVGVISRETMMVIHELLPHSKRFPTCFQIRWAGVKGMVALDDRLEGRKVLFRDESMRKFESSDTANLEICDMASGPIPLVLNRQIIKILEDMNVPFTWFSRLQAMELGRLRKITRSTSNTQAFLNRHKIGSQIRFSHFIGHLEDLGIDYKRDRFMTAVVEAVVLREVRLLKHKARIPVNKGVTLFGIMDETKYLKEGEIFITFEETNDIHPMDFNGQEVLVTRSPALHPGDIQKAKAVVPPFDHPLRSLSNCICFSQMGNADLPSQLSGGDLDGDLYHIIFDETAVAAADQVYPAADYPRVKPVDIGREVQSEDVQDFLVTFMQTDKLGTIATRHMVRADMKDEGTVDPDCVRLAALHSTAVDYSKTGVPVDLEALRKLGNPRYRPDFLAPAPPAEVTDRSEINFDAPAEFNDNADADDNSGPQFKWVRSDKVLGQLYRAIDEKKIWNEDIHQARKRDNSGKTSSLIWRELLEYLKDKSEGFDGVGWQSALEEARGIQEAYDGEMANAAVDFSDHAAKPLTEVEVFTGSIFNKKGVQSRRQRDRSIGLKEEIGRILTSVDALILRQKRKPADEDEFDDDDYLGYHSDPHQPLISSDLQLSLACLHVACDKPMARGGRRRNDVESYESFKMVAAQCALRALEANKGSKAYQSKR